MHDQVRVRFAPSPTGPLHMGGVRTALFNYLFARKHNGKFILRIEDTDQTRFIPGAEEYIINSLKWCGLEPDEGVTVGGDFTPYRQSERKDLYKKYVQRLIDTGNAYYAFDTAEELDAVRKSFEVEKKTFAYDHKMRMSMRNSLTLKDDEVQKLMNQNEPYVIRFKMPEDAKVEMHDMVRGKVHFHSSTLDDKVLFKSDGLPTYHLANVVDDHEMKITHVIRGEEWLPSLPLHVLLYSALGWEKEMPEFAHLPLILKPAGKGKLSKRDGDKGGFPVFPLEWNSPDGEIASGYREEGYFPEAFINMLALLGWNPGTEQELFSKQELIDHFSIERVGKSGARFDPEKAKWFNHQYLVNKSDEELTDLFIPLLKEKGIDSDRTWVLRIVSMVKERAFFVQDLWEQSAYFFEAPQEYDKKVIKKRWKEGVPQALSDIKQVISQTESFESTNLEEKIKAYITSNELNMGQIMNSLRLTLVGGAFGVHLFDIMEIIGKEETLNRIQKGLDTIKR